MPMNLFVVSVDVAVSVDLSPFNAEPTYDIASFFEMNHPMFSYQ